MIGSKEKAATDGHDLREIAIDLIDEVLAEGRDARDGIMDEREHQVAQADALKRFGEGHDPKILARALIIAISDRLSGIVPPAETP